MFRFLLPVEGSSNLESVIFYAITSSNNDTAILAHRSCQGLLGLFCFLN